MTNKSIHRAAVIFDAQSQRQAMIDEPSLELGLPCPGARLETVLAQIEARRRSVDEAKLNWRGEVRRLNDEVAALRDAVRANRAVAAMQHGAESAAVNRLGGGPRKSARRKRGQAPDSSGADPQQQS